MAQQAIRIPLLGQAMEAATIVEWLVKDGEEVQAGQPLYRLESEKVEQEVESPCGGVIHLVGEAGQTYQVGVEVAAIDRE